MENNKLITREYFNNEYLSEVTMIQDDDKIIWFKGVDIASILGYSDKKKSIRMHVDDSAVAPEIVAHFGDGAMQDCEGSR